MTLPSNCPEVIRISTLMLGSLFDRGPLDRLQEFLVSRAPKWSAGLHVWRFRKRDSTFVDTSRASSLYEAVRANALERGSLYRALQAQRGDSVEEPLSGSAELRGANRSIDVVVSMSDRPFTPSPDGWQFTNRISIGVYRKSVEGIISARWSLVAIESLCSSLSPAYARICSNDETNAKNMCFDHGVCAIGAGDASYLRGLYWANFFGGAYCDLIGRDKLLSAPAHEAKEVGTGVLILLSEKPEEWNTPEYKNREQRFLDHVGREYFFERDNPDKPTKSPFNLPPRPPAEPGNTIQVLHQGGGKYEVLNPDLREKLGLPPLVDETLHRFGLQPPDDRTTGSQ